MEIRLFEYGFYLAKQDAIVEEGMMTIRIPNQAVIFIEENSNIRDQRMRIIFPSGEEIIYDVETLRFWEYSIPELREKKMYNLLPLVIFKHRKILKRLVDNKPKSRIIEVSPKVSDRSIRPIIMITNQLKQACLVKQFLKMFKILSSNLVISLVSIERVG